MNDSQRTNKIFAPNKPWNFNRSFRALDESTNYFIKQLAIVLTVLLLAPLAALHAADPPIAATEPRPPSIIRDFPGGNIEVEKIEGDDVYLHQELRDTQGDWFYWYFAVQGAEGRELTFHFTASKAVGLLGPGISRDKGTTWHWLGRTDSPTTFKYKFAATESEVRFSVGMPYQHADLQRFLQKRKVHPHLKIEVLGNTRKGTPVELLRLGCVDGSPAFKVLVTVRHHACEMMASYVAEGLMDEFLSDTEAGDWLRKHVQCAVVPMVDKDGVENGDQGKNRWPHDHKADYHNQSIYPEVAALREFVGEWSNNEPNVTLDLHDPTLNGRVIYTHALRGTTGRTAEEIAAIRDKSNAMRFLQSVEKEQTGPLRFRVQDSLDFAARIAGVRPESEVVERQQNAAATARSKDLPVAPVSIGFEIPYALVGDIEVTPDSARAFGNDIARALAAYLKSSKP